MLLGLEAAILVGMVGAIRGTPAPNWHGFSHTPAEATQTDPAWSFAAGAAPAVEVDIGHADLTIETRPGSRIEVSVAPGMEISSSGPIAAREDGGKVRITAANSGAAKQFYVDERNVHVTVPPATHVVVLRAGDISASGLRAAASFVSDHGFIEISDADCSTLHVESANGRVVLTNVIAAQIDASSTNGRVEGRALQLRDGSVSSANGRVSLQFAGGTDTTVNAEAGNGKVRVSGFAAAAAVPVQRADDEQNGGDTWSARTVRIGAGEGRLDVHASNGNIDLTQEG